ncbi:PTS system, cellobiose-specific IIB component [Alkalibacterium subtropicum]|uniref:PTS system, cellobiose-specific IIB component n=1 Tax=Alkalibacterium subtropicum TaxID=753702 RepID=A0A1I1GL07_9LACT|nr:PTS sugar transporter subunit IIB [Alkalibacterium subtropicum]SFC12467.1 PTS system, cellobiose-specific IIB component [Alkalibacterium subtropicum]
MATKNIMLVCAAGMSTSILVTKMQEIAEQRSLDVHIFAVSGTEAEDKLKDRPVDIMMLGPQVRYMKPKFEDLAEKNDIIIEVIDMRDYGTMNGENVLNTALKLTE